MNILSRPFARLKTGLPLCAFALAACTSLNDLSPADRAAPSAPVPTTAHATAPTPAERAAIRSYIAKLPDRDYVQTYGGPDAPRPWYTAAEALGALGAPAIPALIARLDTPDPYELKLALYALMLASQDPALLARPEYEALRLGTVLTPATNAENRRRALEWWERQSQP